MTSATVLSELNALIQREASLLDDWNLDGWLDLYADDAVYVIPIDTADDPRKESSIVFDDKHLLKMRVHQLIREIRVAQVPRSEYLHFIANVHVEADGDGARARYNLLVVEMRIGDWRQVGIGKKHLFVGRCTMQFRQSAQGWKIVEKRIVLLDRAQPIEGLSFIL
jgi:3-phenylpropionate/cinnamic acid dioxygenase small subunit